MSTYIYGYIMPGELTGARDRHIALAMHILDVAHRHAMHAHLGFGIPSREITQELCSLVGSGSYYDYMPFLLVDAPFDNASNELIEKFQSEDFRLTDLREALSGFVEGVSETCASKMYIAVDSGYKRELTPISVRNVAEFQHALNQLFPDHNQIESGEIFVDFRIR